MAPLFILAALAASSPGVEVTGHHDVSSSADELRIRSTLVVDPRQASGELALTFVQPLPATCDVQVEGGRLRRDAVGNATGLTVDTGHRSRWPVRISVTDTLKATNRRGRLPLPAPRTAGVHRVQVAPELRLSVSDDLHIVHRIGRHHAPEIDREARHRTDDELRRFDERRAVGAWYFSATHPVFAERGLVATLVKAEDARTRAFGGAAVGFAGIVGGLALVYRRLAGAVRLERAEAFLAQMDNDDDDRAPPSA